MKQNKYEAIERNNPILKSFTASTTASIEEILPLLTKNQRITSQSRNVLL